MRLHIIDGFKLIHDEGPLDKNPRRRILHGAVHAATDAVALDTIGAELVEQARAGHRLPTLARVGRRPDYLDSAARLGLGVAERGKITLREVRVWPCQLVMVSPRGSSCPVLAGLLAGGTSCPGGPRASRFSFRTRLS